MRLVVTQELYLHKREALCSLYIPGCLETFTTHLIMDYYCCAVSEQIVLALTLTEFDLTTFQQQQKNRFFLESKNDQKLRPFIIDFAKHNKKTNEVALINLINNF